MMKYLALLLIPTIFLAQEVGVPSWRAGLSALPPRPPATTSDQDIARFERNMRQAATYLGNTAATPGTAQWEANRALVRNMAAYLYGLRALAGSDGQLRGSIYRAQRSFDALGLATYLALGNSAAAGSAQDGAGPGSAPLTPPPPSAMPPPFALSAPDLADVSAADKDVAAELRARYETDAATSASVWQNAETLRENLEARGAALNVQTATSMIRLPLHFNGAATALRRNDWDGARTHLQQAEAETQKIAKTVGR